MKKEIKGQGSEERLVVILTEFKEIFCGWTSDTTGERIQLRNARQACYFLEGTQGLLGLAVSGPASGSKIGPPANIEVRRIVNVIECGPAAVEAWENAKWAK
jgi:hypothetical protein